ncbi:MAG TPA: GGDEF domain-containing protein [Hyphomonadaceae bacterium]|nr:GGDEF domain-containing protein [Hyphomonadaceae bacterium]
MLKFNEIVKPARYLFFTTRSLCASMASATSRSIPYNRSLRGRFTLLIAGTIGLFAVALILVNCVLAINAAEQAIRREAASIANALHSADYFAAPSKSSNQALLKAFRNERGLIQAAYAPSIVPMSADSIQSIHRMPETLEILVKVGDERGPRFLALTFDRAHTRALVWPNVWPILVVAVLLMAMTIPIADMSIRNTTNSIRHLTDFAWDASARRLSARIDLKTGDELESLANAFNRMLRRLDASMKRMQHLAFVDGATELPNRERFLTEIRAAAEQLERSQGAFAIMLLDLDRFGRVNETLGHERADELLGLVAQRLASAVRAGDRVIDPTRAESNPTLVARIAADEFGLLIPLRNDASESGRLAQLVIAALRQPFMLHGQTLVVGASAGVAVMPTDAANPQTALRAAQLALHYAKQEGGGRIRFYTAEMGKKAQARMSIETELRLGIERGEIIAHFQPKVDLAKGHVIGAEALARWRRSTGEIVMPGAFIEVAEETGLIAQIGESVLRDACKWAAAISASGRPLRVAVNVSAVQFTDERFIQRVLKIVEEAKLNHGLLELEITESVAMSDPDRVAEMIEPLRARGVRFAIDDFGTGFSSLAALTRLPFDTFKIDRQFVKGLGEDRHAPVLIETILAMATSLDYETVAEGVETLDQAAFLRRRGCNVAQGYLFGRPEAPEGFLANLQEHSANFGAMLQTAQKSAVA